MMDRRQFLGTTAAAAVTAAMNPGELPAASGATFESCEVRQGQLGVLTPFLKT